MNQTTSVNEPLSCDGTDDSLSEASDSEATDDNQDEGMDMDYISDESDEHEDKKDPDWNVLEEGAENEKIGDDEEQSGSVASQNNIK